MNGKIHIHVIFVLKKQQKNTQVGRKLWDGIRTSERLTFKFEPIGRTWSLGQHAGAVIVHQPPIVQYSVDVDAIVLGGVIVDGGGLRAH